MAKVYLHKDDNIRINSIISEFEMGHFGPLKLDCTVLLKIL